jgi:glycopeptide antibiotics resistance protein
MRKRIIFFKLVNVIACVFYFSALFYLVFLARRRGAPRLDKRGLVLLKPFQEPIHFFKTLEYQSSFGYYSFFTNLVGNIFLFIPFAYFAITVFKLFSNKKIILFSFLLSVSIEFIQYLFDIGVADIDDVILNVTGAFIGLLLCNVLGVKNKIPVRQV